MTESASSFALATHAGRIILENGGETHRVEDTITRIALAFGFSRVHCFVTPTGIMASANGPDGAPVSLVRRIRSRTVDMEKIRLVNELSRRIAGERLDLAAVEDEIVRIERTLPPRPAALILWSGIVAAAMTLLIDGGLGDAIAAAIAGMTMRAALSPLFWRRVNAFFMHAAGAGVIAAVVLIASRCLPDLAIDRSTIGAIMLLVPGIAITNSVRDILAGDLLAGVARGVEAVLVAAALAVGSGLVFKLWLLAGLEAAL
jgi:uncharacterized membrane protein YjjP (DUF1212 family)